MKRLESIDIAFLPMNLPYTMTPEMVAEAAMAFRPKVLYPYHFGRTETSKLLTLLKDAGEIDKRYKGRLVKEAVVKTIISKAIRGDVQFAKEILNRLEGKVPERVHLDGGLDFKALGIDPDGEDELAACEVALLATRARARALPPPSPGGGNGSHDVDGKSGDNGSGH